MKERRRHFLINKPLQLRYMSYITVTLVTITLVALFSLYIGIWSSILDSFSNAAIRTDMLTAARLNQYEEARYGAKDPSFSALSLFKQTEKLSTRQREVFKNILNESNRDIAIKLILLFFFIAWGSIFLTHKVAGPLYRFHTTLKELGRGNLQVRIHLRKFDEGKEVADDFNQFISFLDDHHIRIKKIVREHQNNPSLLIGKLNEELSKVKTSDEI